MSSHEITVEPHWQAHGVFIRCSCNPEALTRVGDIGSPATLAEIIEVARKHMEEMFPALLVEEMNRPSKILLTEEQARQMFGGQP